MKNINKVNKIDFKTNTTPLDIKNFSYDELDNLCEGIRKEILDVTSKNGGHLSSNLGVVELTVGLYKNFDFSKDKIIFDVGHQCYTYKLLTGRPLTTLRKKGGVSGFQKRSESIYDCYEAGHSSTSISAAEGFAIARDLKNEDYNVVALIGDSSIASGMSFEAINNLSQRNNKIIIILNDNNMSISKPVGSVSKIFSKISTNRSYTNLKYKTKHALDKKGTKALFEFLRKTKNSIKSILVTPTIFDYFGFQYIGPINGNDIKAVDKAIKRAKNTQKSVIIHATTIKGKGYKFAENDSNGYWHGVPAFDLKTGEPLNKRSNEVSWSHVFADLVNEKLSVDKNAVVISPATIKGSNLDIVFDRYADRCFDVGIEEEHAVTLASGLACNGFHPIISIYSTFMQRAFDQISHDIARMNLNCTFLVDRAGLVGSDGETHQGIYDGSFLANTPGCVVCMPTNASEAEILFNESFNNHGPFFIRLPRDYISKEQSKTNRSIKFGEWPLVKSSKEHKTVILSVGPLTNDIVSLSKDKDIDVYNCIYTTPINIEILHSLLGYKHIVIYDPYSTSGSFVDKVKAYLLDNSFKGKVTSYSVPLTFVKQSSIKEQLLDFHINPEEVINNL